MIDDAMAFISAGFAPLKPCPFCDGKADFVGGKDDGWWVIKCEGCRAEFDLLQTMDNEAWSGDTISRAIKSRWNIRVVTL